MEKMKRELLDKIASCAIDAYHTSKKFQGSTTFHADEFEKKLKEKGIEIEEPDYLKDADGMGCDCVNDFRRKIELLYKAIKQLKEKIEGME